MFVRAKKSGRYEYLQVVQNERVDGRVCQRVIATVGRVDQLQKEGHIDAILSSCSRFAQNVAVMDAHKRGALPPVETVKIGPPLVFERLWRDRKIKDVLEQLLRGRKYEFPVERAIFMTVLHRLMVAWRVRRRPDSATQRRLQTQPLGRANRRPSATFNECFVGGGEVWRVR